MRRDSESSRTGEILIYIDRKRRFKVIAIDSSDRNWWTITIKVNEQNYKDVIMLVYHSPSGSVAEFLNYMENTYVDDITNDNIINMGDFNIDMNKVNYVQNRLNKIMNFLGVKQLVEEATRITLMSETLIDLLFSNVKVEVSHVHRISDHSVVVINWDSVVAVPEERRIVYRDYERLNVDRFKRLVVSSINGIIENNVHTMADKIVGEIVYSLDQVAPEKVVVLKDKWKGKQWFTQDVYNLIKQRDKAYKVACVSKNRKDWETFRRLRNRTVDKCREEKRKYLERKMDKNKEDPKKMWTVLKEIVKGKSNLREYKEIQIGNRTINNNVKMAEEINCYFIDSIKQIIRGSCDESGEEEEKIINISFERFRTIEVEELARTVMKLKNKAGTEEEISVEIMKFVMEVAGKKICELVNKSLEKGTCPDQWKEAIVIPICKVINTIKIKEFRPINKLPIFEKILKLMVQIQLMVFFFRRKRVITGGSVGVQS